MQKSRYFQREMDFSDSTQRETVIKHFSENNNLSLNIENFKNLLSDLLSDSNGSSYEISDLKLNKLFTVFDENKDGVIDEVEFIKLSDCFIQPLVKPVTALLVIDVQNDFIDGSLALKTFPAKQDGSHVIPVINHLIEEYEFDIIVYSHDYHPKDHISFYDNFDLHKHKLRDKNKSQKVDRLDTVVFEGKPAFSQKLWPTHCVQHTWGSELHEDLKIADNSIYIFKGRDPSIDSYSAFFDNQKLSKTALDEDLKEKKVTHVFVCGLAFDYCVSSTAIDALELGYSTVVIQDATRGTDSKTISSAEEKLKSLNCVLANSCEMESLITGKDIKVEFAMTLQSALEKK